MHDLFEQKRLVLKSRRFPGPDGSGGGYVDNGVVLKAVRRIYEDFSATDFSVRNNPEKHRIKIGYKKLFNLFDKMQILFVYIDMLHERLGDEVSLFGPTE